MSQNLKLPKSISKIMEELGFNPKAPKSSQIAFLKYISNQMRTKKYGYKVSELKNKQKQKENKKILHIEKAYKQNSLFEEEAKNLKNKKTS